MDYDYTLQSLQMTTVYPRLKTVRFGDNLNTGNSPCGVLLLPAPPFELQAYWDQGTRPDTA